MDRRLQERRLLTRGTFGPRPGELEAIHDLGAAAWVEAQLAEPLPEDPELDRRLSVFPSLQAGTWQELVDMDLPGPQMRGPAASRRRKELSRRAKEISHDLVGARLVRAVHGRLGVREVMLDFWSNHFSVFGRKSLVGALLPHYEREVLLPRALGRFEDLLLAVARSPAMLVYLDNWRSTRADLPRSVRRRVPGLRGQAGINENYARELLELHTLGIDGGYDQRDVIEVARVFTGWTLESRQDPVFRFRDVLHDGGRKRVLGKRVRGRGLEEGEGLLRRLARHPATAGHLAHKLCARFVADAPPPALVARVAQRYLETDGEIRAVVREVLLAPELADPRHRKLKTPFRFVAGCVRETGGACDGRRASLAMLARLGEAPYYSRTPDGHPEEAAHWIDPGALLERMSIAFLLAEDRVPGTRLGSALPEAARGVPAPRAASLAERQGLALASPEFQWT